MGGKNAKEEPPKQAAPSLQEASMKIDSRIQDLEAKISKAEEEAKTWIVKKDNPSAKARAMQALKRKKQYEEQRDKLVGTQFNVENLAFQQEQADVTMTAVAAMQQATAQLNQQKVDVAQVDQLVDDMEELNAQAKEIQEALSRPMGTMDASADDDLEAEFAKMQEQHAMEMLMGGAASSTSVPAAAVPAVPAAAAPSAPVAGGYAKAAAPTPAQALATPA
eukprot:TRINITY_DN7684_c0_g1_i2.p1 TRINITY_DN7684_c0_g1~~TRINITY_DN7684_c0_g1_i2.p1  ORF type:complete len:221 (+),score=95.01 TRINITY_DN7684_c0_g1_i2:84-746(+)